jgi:pantetheine-phosphate adenylyltransferase
MYKLCGCGGTFDHLNDHDGHKLLLKTCFNLAEQVAIGLVTDEFIQKVEKEFDNLIESYEVRKNNILEYVKSLNPEYSERCTIIPLNDPFGPAITDPNIEVHVSSEETYQVALKINELRSKNGVPRMIIVIIPLVLGENGTRISSTKIRKKISKK